MTADLLTLNSSKTEFLLIGLKKQLDKIHNPTLNTTHSARNLGFIFGEHHTFSDQMSAISKAYYYRIRQLRCIRPYLGSTTVGTTATSIVHSKLDYCNSVYYNLPKSQITRLQQIQNYLARAGDLAFPVAATLTWKSLPQHITSTSSLSVFRARLTSISSHCGFPHYCRVYLAVTCRFGHFNPSFIMDALT